jgi:hypothetical protein
LQSSQFENINTVEKQTALTWKDPETGLEWQCQSPGAMSWHQALEYAESLVLDGKSDWRLPTVCIKLLVLHNLCGENEQCLDCDV